MGLASFPHHPGPLFAQNWGPWAPSSCYSGQVVPTSTVLIELVEMTDCSINHMLVFSIWMRIDWHKWLINIDKAIWVQIISLLFTLSNNLNCIHLYVPALRVFVLFGLVLFCFLLLKSMVWDRGRGQICRKCKTLIVKSHLVCDIGKVVNLWTSAFSSIKQYLPYRCNIQQCVAFKNGVMTINTISTHPSIISSLTCFQYDLDCLEHKH